MGHKDVVLELVLELLLVCLEWQAGVLSAERPAERAMWSSGFGGKENRS